MPFDKSLAAFGGPGAVDVDEITSDLSAIQSTILVGFAGFAILVYDHVITFADEVKYVWQGFRGPVVYLFLINRYLIPLGFIVNLIAYLSDWDAEFQLVPREEDRLRSPSRCARFVRYGGSMTVIGINVVGLMMLIWVKALYGNNKKVVWPVTALLAFEFGVNVWLLFYGTPARYIVPKHPCTIAFKANRTKIAAASAWLPLLYDTVFMALTAYKAFRFRSLSHGFPNPVMRTLLAEGMFYYGVVFSPTLTLAVMIAVAPPTTQNIAAQLVFLLTIATMSRVIISLKKALSEIVKREDEGVISTFVVAHSFVDQPYAPTTPRPTRSCEIQTHDSISLVSRDFPMVTNFP